ncbi:MAG: 3-dehydroquinate synthase, partial [Methyloceanibacter sp.]
MEQVESVQGRSAETEILVTLASRGYPIIIGEDLTADAGPRLKELLPGARFAVVSDANVAALHLDPLKASLERENLFLGSAVV